MDHNKKKEKKGNSTEDRISSSTAELLSEQCNKQQNISAQSVQFYVSLPISYACICAYNKLWQVLYARIFSSFESVCLSSEHRGIKYFEEH